MISIAITGGIGSGKSYVSNLLQEQGIPIYNADNEAKRLMLSDDGIRSDLISLLGKDVYQGDVLNKTLLASFLFANTKNAARVNQIVHPRVRTDFSRWLLEHSDYGIVGIECAILFEAKFADIVDVVVMVYAPEAIRIARAMKRDHATEGQIRARMAAQLDDEVKCALSDYIITNDGTVSVEEQITSLIAQLKENNGINLGVSYLNCTFALRN